MKNKIITLGAYLLAGSLAAQTATTNPAATADLLAIPNNDSAAPAVSAAAPATPVAPAVDASTAAAQTATPAAPATEYTSAQLQELLGPIALYPDALIAIILPAATEPTDVVMASRFVADKGDPALIPDQPWDDSVKALAHYPDVVTWMDENLNWTKTVGDAFLRQPADVMKAVQALRAQAKAAGTLVDTPQQNVVTDGSTIVIQPAQPNVIYVPQYDPQVVYVQQTYAYPGPYVVFGAAWPVGPWLNFQCNWFGFGIWTGIWTPGVWYYPRAFWAQPVIIVAGRPCRPWLANPRRVVVVNRDFRQGVPPVPHPRLMAGAPMIAHANGGNEVRPGEARSPGLAPHEERPVATVASYGHEGMPVPTSPAPGGFRGPEVNGGERSAPVEPRTPAPSLASHEPSEGRGGLPMPSMPAPTLSEHATLPESGRTFTPMSPAPSMSRPPSYTPHGAPTAPASYAPGGYRSPTYVGSPGAVYSHGYTAPAAHAPAGYSGGGEAGGRVAAPVSGTSGHGAQP
jgi:hypothetical protein